MKPAHTKNILVLGLGNPVLADDTIGLLIVEKAREQWQHALPAVAFQTLTACTIDLIDEIQGYSRLLLIDSIHTGREKPGYCHRYLLDDFSGYEQSCLVNLHSMNLPTIIAGGTRLGYTLPGEVVIFGIEGREFTRFSCRPCRATEKNIPLIMQQVSRQLRQWDAFPPVQECTTVTRPFQSVSLSGR